MPLGGGSSLNQLASQPPTPQSIQSLPQSVPQPQSPIQAPQFPQTQLPAQSASPSAGDIILNAATPKKSKTSLAILIIALFICVGVGVVFLIQNIKNNNNPSIVNPISVQNTFNQYANYVLLGKESTEEIKDFDINDKFAIDERSEDEEFLEKCKELYNLFSENFVNSDKAKETILSLQSTDEYYDFLIEKEKLSKINEDELFQIYVNDGKEASDEYVRKYYTEEKYLNYLTRSLIRYNQEYMETIVQEWQIYDNAGCRQGDSYDQLCISNMPFSDIKQISIKLGDIESSINLLISQPINGIKEQIQEYRYIIYEEKNSVSKHTHNKGATNV